MRIAGVLIHRDQRRCFGGQSVGVELLEDKLLDGVLVGLSS